jgi:hypothetical protein
VSWSTGSGSWPDWPAERHFETIEGPHRDTRSITMGKTGRKRRARKKKGANHGKRPNA